MTKKVDNVVNYVLESYFINAKTSTIVVEDIIKQQGVNIKCLSYLDEGMKHAYTVTNKDSISIEYSKETYNLYYVRKRFALVHALGHIMLGHSLLPYDDRCDIISNYSSSVTDVEEQEANEFARKILVPKDLFDAAVLKCSNFEELCDFFNVSEVLMKLRISEITGL